MDLTCPPPGHKLTKLGFSWGPDGALTVLRGYDGADLIFTLVFTLNPDGTLSEVARS